MAVEAAPIPDKPGGKRESVPVAELVVLSSPEIERAARVCPLLAKELDHEAWIECCTRRFLRLSVRIAGGDAQARDALQESWIKILQYVDEYKKEPRQKSAAACAWVRAIVVNCAHDARNAESRMVGLPDSAPDPEDPGAGPEVVAGQVELYRLLDAMVKELPEMYRQVVELRYGRELSTKEAAAKLHITPATVATRLSRAVKRLCRSLAKHTQDGHPAPPSGGKTPS